MSATASQVSSQTAPSKGETDLAPLSAQRVAGVSYTVWTSAPLAVSSALFAERSWCDNLSPELLRPPTPQLARHIENESTPLHSPRACDSTADWMKDAHDVTSIRPRRSMACVDGNSATGTRGSSARIHYFAEDFSKRRTEDRLSSATGC